MSPLPCPAPPRTQWNFFKFLVGRDGMPLKLFAQNFDGETLEAEVCARA